MGGTNMSKLCGCTGRNKKKKKKDKCVDVANSGVGIPSVAKEDDKEHGNGNICVRETPLCRTSDKEEFHNIQKWGKEVISSPDHGHEYKVCKFLDNGRTLFIDGWSRNKDTDNHGTEVEPYKSGDIPVDNSNKAEVADVAGTENQTVNTNEICNGKGNSKRDLKEFNNGKTQSSKETDWVSMKDRINMWKVRQQRELKEKLQECCLCVAPNISQINRGALKMWSRHMASDLSHGPIEMRTHSVPDTGNIETDEFKSGARDNTGSLGMIQSTLDTRDRNVRPRAANGERTQTVSDRIFMDMKPVP